MPVITCQTPFYIFKLQFITRICSFHTFEFSFHSDFIFRTQPSYHLTCIVKIKMKSQIIHTLRNRHYLRFFIKLKFPFFFYMFFHHSQTFFQILSIIMDQNTVIHIPGVISDSQFFLYDTIHSIKIYKCKPLASLIAQWQTFPKLRMIAPKYHTKQPQQFFIEYTCLLQYLIHYPVIYRVKIFSYVTFQDIPCSPMIPVVFSHESSHSLHREMCSFAFSACRIIINQPFIKCRLYYIVAQAMLQHTIMVFRRKNQPLFRIVYLEGTVWPDFVESVFQLILESNEFVRQIIFKSHNFLCIPLPTLCHFMSLVQLLKAAYHFISIFFHNLYCITVGRDYFAFCYKAKISDFKKLLRFKTLPICILPSPEGRNRIPLQYTLTDLTRSQFPVLTANRDAQHYYHC